MDTFHIPHVPMQILGIVFCVTGLALWVRYSNFDTTCTSVTPL